MLEQRSIGRKCRLEKLNTLLKHAYENVHYCGKCFDERTLKTKDIQDFKDMKEQDKAILGILKEGEMEI